MTTPFLTFYRRILPLPAVSFSSEKGRMMLTDALSQGNATCFFELIEQFRTQDEPAFCGLATLSMSLNSLEIDPHRRWKGVWRWFNEELLDCCEPLDTIKKKGITFAGVVCLAKCNGAEVKSYFAKDSTEKEFRQSVKAACQQKGNVTNLVVSYSRQEFNQTGDGHFSPIGAYHAPTDSILVLDVARFKYPPHWVTVADMWKSMNRIDQDSGKCRGYMILSKKEGVDNNTLFTVMRHRPDNEFIFGELSKMIFDCAIVAYNDSSSVDNSASINEKIFVSTLICCLNEHYINLFTTYQHDLRDLVHEEKRFITDHVDCLLAEIKQLKLYQLIEDKDLRNFNNQVPLPENSVMDKMDWNKTLICIALLSMPQILLEKIPGPHGELFRKIITTDKKENSEIIRKQDACTDHQDLLKNEIENLQTQIFEIAKFKLSKCGSPRRELETITRCCKGNLKKS